MKLIITGCLAALFLLPACSGQNDNSPSEASAEANSEGASAALSALVEEYFERNLELNPIRATSTSSVSGSRVYPGSTYGSSDRSINMALDRTCEK